VTTPSAGASRFGVGRPTTPRWRDTSAEHPVDGVPECGWDVR
jgi:hypothetical protein